MGLMDKVKAGVKAGAEQAAAKVEEGMERLQTKRELATVYTNLGRTAFELFEKGELTHPDLQPLAEDARRLRAELAADSAQAAEAAKEEPPAAGAAPGGETSKPDEPPAGS